MRTRTALLGLVLGVSAGPPAAQLPRPPAARIVNITAPGRFTEPSIAVDALHPERVVVAYQDPIGIAYSRDSGRTWQQVRGVEVAPRDYRVSGDVSVTFDTQGAAIACFIAFDHLGTNEYWAHNATRNGVFVRRSPDGGASWDSAYHAIAAWPTTPGIPFEDKPYIVADNTHGPHAGRLYVGWTHFTLDSSLILLSHSSDGGVHWSAPMRISTRGGLPRDDNGSVEGFTGAVGPDGTLYVVWADGSHVVFTTSSDGGESFAPSRPVIETAASYFKVHRVDRANGFPQIGIDPASGRLYVSWADYRNGDTDVFVATSSDRGRTWTAGVRVNSDALHNGADQFFQWLAVDAATGAANVVFYDRRGDSTNRRALIVLARSTDGGRAFANYAWTDTLFDAREEFIGDYTGIAAFGGRVYAAWTEVDSAAADAPGQPPGRRHARIRVGTAVF